MPGKKCEPGCTCGRHSAEFKAKVAEASKQRAALLTAEDKTERGRKAWANTSEDKKYARDHSPNRKCKPGCTCPKHTPEFKAKLQASAREQYIREGGSEGRSKQTKEVWAKRTQQERSAIGAKILAKKGRMVWSPEIVRKRAEACKATWAKKTLEERRAHLGPALSARGRQATNLEFDVASVLEFLGYEYEYNHLVTELSIVVDFYIEAVNLMIEADGKYWHTKPGIPEKDQKRDDDLINLGYKIIRIKEEDVKTDPIKAVSRAILSAIN